MIDTFNDAVEAMVRQMAEREEDAKRQKEIVKEASYRFALSKVSEEERQWWDILLVNKDAAYAALYPSHKDIVDGKEYIVYTQSRLPELQRKYMRRALNDYIEEKWRADRYAVARKN